MASRRFRLGAALGVMGLAVVACGRAPAAVPCPEVEVGTLVVTELRGSQGGPDTYGQWVEIHNAGDNPLDPAGTRIVLRRLDGSGEREILLRQAGLELPAGGYLVAGRSLRPKLPAHLDYNYADDFDGDLYGAGIVEVYGCGAAVGDRMVYRSLPDVGSLALDGADAPDAVRNDDEGAWCADAEQPGSGTAANELGRPGTPGKGNRPCR